MNGCAQYQLPYGGARIPAPNVMTIHPTDDRPTLSCKCSGKKQDII